MKRQTASRTLRTATQLALAAAWTMAAVAGVARAAAPKIPLPDVADLPSIAELPDPFLMSDGRRVASKADWERRREEIREIIQHYQYGRMFPAPKNVRAEETLLRQRAEIGGLERQLLIITGPDDKVRFRCILSIPRGKGPFPAIIKGDLCWGRVTTPTLQNALQRGYIVAEFDRTEVAPDNADRTQGLFPLYPECDGATLAAWAWGFHRVVDYLLTLDIVDPGKIAVTGHSRGGKTALLAGALDERIALVNPNGSGCGGSGCYRCLGEKSEDVAAITRNFSYWFHPRLKEFIGKVDRMPFDQHYVKALVAPRPFLTTEGLGDLWANPLGTQMSNLAAAEVYTFLGAPDKIGLHYRPGGHAHNTIDWNALLDFADLHFFGKKVETRFDQLPFPDAKRPFSWSAPK